MSKPNIAQLPATKAAATHEITDVGNSRRLAVKYHPELRYVPQRGKWLLYRDHAWHTDHLGLATRYSIEVTRDMMAEAAQLSMQAARVRLQDEDEADRLAAQAQALLAHARRSQQRPRLEAMLAIAQSEPEVVVSQDDLDDDDWILGVKNGVLDLRTGVFQPGKPEDLITRQAGCEYAGGWEDVACPTWQKFLEQIQPDADVRGWLQRLVGYCLTGSTQEQIFTVFHGVGANGKSVFSEVLRKLLGGYAVVTQFSTFVEQRQDAIRNDLATLDKARLVVAAEGPQSARLEEGIVKQVTGGDPVTARFLHREFFTFAPRFKVILVSNHKPIISGTDHGIWRRVVLVPFPVVIPPEAQDRSLSKRLEAELPGILGWALQGLAKYLEVGLQLPPELEQARIEYRADCDLFGAWLEDVCEEETDAGAWEGATDLYQSYRQWALDAGLRPWSAKNFGGKLRERGFVSAKKFGLRGWSGLRLRRPGEGQTKQDMDRYADHVFGPPPDKDW